MRFLISYVLAAVASLCLPPQANACRVMQTAQQRISNVYSNTQGVQVALVRIVEARHLSFPLIRKFPERFRLEETPWRAAATVTQLVVGEESPEIVVFDRGWGHSACDDGTLMPKPGDFWVAYYQVGRMGEAQVIVTYPLKVAQAADPRLKSNGRYGPSIIQVVPTTPAP